MAKVLQNIYLFKDLDTFELERVSQLAQEITYNAGDEIFSKGDTPDAFFAIKMGSVVIKTLNKVGDETRITTMGTGSHFGEMPLLDGEKRSATAQCLEPTTVFRLRYADLKKLISESEKTGIKIYKSLATYLCGRLRMTTEDLNYAREQNLKHF